MAKSPNQKLKLLYLQKILQEKTDETHTMNVAQLIRELQRYDISAERKSIYDDIEALKQFGLDIECSRSKPRGYYIASRQFELPELKLLVDAVQSSKFITHKKSNSLIKKVETLTNIHEAQLLQRQVFVANRIKTMNESIYYNIDKIHTAISQGMKIEFQYFEWTIKKERKYKKQGEFYCISPWALSWVDENYYMIGFDNEMQIIKHYRVDKMVNITLTEEPRDGQDHFNQFDMALYTNKLFGMFGGEEETIKLLFSNRFIGVVLDRFGKEISVIPYDDTHFIIHLKVALSPQFFSWLFGFSTDVKILSPQRVADLYLQQAQEITLLYQ
ncbi:WYL domain-containing protein [Paludicola sp. MB14-C6]|uniref:helix-turn-helix transcriptional regulator n=1 Tax=Paludihabitans sp. MB14-C6 TaxID=3070656 RepID=UPI0027DAE2A1|nr:WYL domain-containing protein [Paludicola sp. MB14-C6]WMJ23853.1 WYL domain-containing protein [Paludicola sp. MB14-C6]